ncbi:MAG TPA: DNA polymerase IV [Gammaproteobacteria bacterium]|nr:DNA polymerase IV [Gammaproteobacteria bacterium]
MIALVDMNAFFASVEQRDRPEWRGQPVAVTNGARGTCIITCSYEARAFAIRTGMRLREARQRCPGLIQAPSRPRVYARTSAAIMQALETITPVVEVFSCDEAFLDLNGVEHLHASAEAMGQAIKRAVFDASGLLCSVGISGDKTTAKWAAKQHKPDGLTLVAPWQARERLQDVTVTELCGVAGGIGRFLRARGVHTCADMARLPVSELGRRFGNPGRRIWLMAQGRDPEPVASSVAEPKSIGHGKVMPPATRSREVILTYLEHMAYKVTRRLRRHRLQAQHFAFAVKADLGWIGGRYATPVPTDDSRVLMHLAAHMLHERWRGTPVHQVQVTALDPHPAGRQRDLFERPDERARARDRAADRIAEKFGESALVPARLLGRSDMPDVIAPAWKPSGHRQTIHR